MSTPGMPDMGKAARAANQKLQRIENARAAAEGRAPINLREQAAANRRAARALAGMD